METNFKLKALKYKKKYVDLKNMIGGANEWGYYKDGKWIAYSSGISSQIDTLTDKNNSIYININDFLYYITRTSDTGGTQLNPITNKQISIERISNSADAQSAAAQPAARYSVPATYPVPATYSVPATYPVNTGLLTIYRSIDTSKLPTIPANYPRGPSSRDGDKERYATMIRTYHYLRHDRVNQMLIETALTNLAQWEQSATSPSPSVMTISVIKGDWGYVTLELTKIYGVPFTVLNMANAINFGGGYKTGAAAQEENMFRRTTCSLDRTGLDYRSDSYSSDMTDLLNGLNDRVYFTKEPRVCFLESDDKNYKHLDPTEIFPFYELRSAAEDISKGKTFDYGDCDRRIRAQLDTLQANGITHVVLSAFGCGAFKNPPLEVATIYRDILNESDRGFKVVVFAIYRPSYSSDNYSPFKHILEPSPGKLTSHLQPLLDKKYPPSVVVAPSKQAYSPNPACQYGLKCTRQNPQHFLDETHPPTHQKAVAIPPPSVTPSKPACPYGLGCTRQNPQHFLDEAHPPTHSLVKAVVIQKCKVPDCYEQHTKHHCGNCGNNDSDHWRRNCPFQQRR
jgi:hypothetical protein